MSDIVGKVYLIAQPSVRRDGYLPDTSALTKHGDVIVLVGAEQTPTKNPDRALELIEHRLENFDHRYDKIAWAGGDTLAAIMTGIIMSELEVPWFWYLKYERNYNPETKTRGEGGYYTPVKISVCPPAHDPNQGSLLFDEDTQEEE